MKNLDFINEKIDSLEEDILFNKAHHIDTLMEKVYLQYYKNIKRDLEVLEIFKKHIELEKEDSDPYDECAFYEDVLYMNLNIEQDISSDEYKIIKQWLEEQDEN